VNDRPLRLLLLGYYGFGNAGDELILSAIQQEVLRVIPNAELKVITSSQTSQTDRHLIPRHHRFRLIAEMSRCDAFILGGGGLIQDKTSVASLLYYLGMVAMARALGRPVFLWSIGVETLAHPLSRRLIRWILSGGGVRIWVRDEESAQILDSLGLRGKVSLSADPCFLLDMAPPPQKGGGATNTLMVIPRKGGILATLPWADFAMACRKDLNLEPALLVMHPQKDDRPLEKIKPAARALHWNNIEELKDHFRQASCVLSERLHGVILSALTGTSFAGIGPQEKTGRFCLKTGAPWLSRPAGHGEIVQLIKNARKTRTAISQNTRQILPELKVRAAAPAEALLRFFNM
jgi:polysaccharide pyruvyl transferase CsaB